MGIVIRRAKILWSLYKPVRGFLCGYVAAVFVGAVLEGLTLMAIVPLVGADTGRVSGIFDSLLDLLGLSSDDRGLIVLVGVLVVLRAVTRYVTTLLAGLMVRREAVRLQVDLFTSYMQVEWDVVVELPKGELQMLLAGQTQRAADFLGRFVQLIEGAIFVVGLTAASFVVSPDDTFLAVVLIGVTGLIVTAISSRIQRYAEAALKEGKSQWTALLQFAHGSSVLRAFGVSLQAVERIESQAEERERLTFRAERAGALAVALPDLLFVLALLSVMAVSFDSQEGVAEVTAVIALLYRISQYLKRFSGLSALRERLPDVRDVHSRSLQFQERRSSLRASSVDTSLPAGAIVLDDVYHRYRGASDAAVDSVTASIDEGQHIGIVGSSGSGKSTLAHIIVGLIEPTAGVVRVGGEHGLSRSDVVAFVPQTPFVLRGSVAENISWFRDVDEQVLERAAERAGLAPVLARLPDGIRSEVAQEGLTLSGGERQRIALARALVGDPRVLLLDEATSALDSESEQLIQRTLDGLHGTVTIVSVAHRLSTVMSADRVWVMEAGELTEDASPAALLKQRGSRFAQLGALQGFGPDDAGP